MIVSKVPFRISFVGGGTDFDDFFETEIGSVISTTIDKYIYVTVIPKFDDKIYIRYSEQECVDSADELKHDLVREALKVFGITGGVEITTISDVPSRGTGLGSSSSLAVALLQAFSVYKTGRQMKAYELASAACKLEIDVLGKPIGRQDQFAAAFGGLNQILFSRCLNSVVPLDFHSPRAEMLKRSTLLFYLGNGRKAESILVEHQNGISKSVELLKRQAKAAELLRNWLLGLGDDDIRAVGELVDVSWQIKKAITPSATNDQIENVIGRARAAGACGAKVCGAGAGGFLMVICDEWYKNQVCEALSDLRQLEFSFENEGARVYKI